VTFLPLIERELRVRARSRAVYWTRFAVALAGILICLPALTASAGPWGFTKAMMGKSAFNGLVSTAFVLCCCAGFLAVEGISRERREGTLGLLFLTRVGAFDVLLGSFGAVGITCVCALIAFLPVLILPVLIGGVTGGEAARTVLVLFDTLFLSLAVGLWAAARGRGWLDCARQALFLLVLLIVAPLLIGVLPGFTVMVSPWYALGCATDPSYAASGARYWLSLAAVHGMSWLLLIAAGIRLRRTMRGDDRTLESCAVESREAREKGWMPKSFVLCRWEIWRAWSRRSVPIEEGTDPIAWLLSRRRGIKAAIWAAVVVEMVYYAELYLGRRVTMRVPYGSFGLGVAVSLVQGCLFAWAASRFFVEARRTGELELLRTTPLGAEKIVSSQWIWLKRAIFWPVVLLVAPNVVASVVAFAQSGPVPSTGYWRVILFNHVLSIVRAILGILALFWVGLWYGLKARSQAGAIVRTILLAKGVPYLVSNLSSVLFALFSFNFIGSGPAPFPVWLSLAPSMAISMAILFYFLWLMGWAKRRLRAELGHEGTARFHLAEHIARVFSSKALYK